MTVRHETIKVYTKLNNGHHPMNGQNNTLKAKHTPKILLPDF